MKKIFLTVLMCVALAPIVHAQFTNFGVQVGGGYSHLRDNLTSKGGIMGVTVGGYVTYSFLNSHSVMADIFYLQGGLNFMRRGGRFEEITDDGVIRSERKTKYSGWYLQIPILANFRYELPLAARGHFARFFVGPAFSFGIFGNYNDRKVTPFRPQQTWNYEIKNDPVFDHAKRIDANLIAGLGYQYGNIVASLYVDYGFLSIGETEDVLHNMETSDASRLGVTNGNIVTYMLSVGYQFPIEHR